MFDFMDYIALETYEYNGLTAYRAKEKTLYNRNQAVYIDTKSLANIIGISHHQLLFYIELNITARTAMQHISLDGLKRAKALHIIAINHLYSVLTDNIDAKTLADIKKQVNSLLQIIESGKEGNK
jgi:magnesium-transporting ATPase (P-type)